jgi:predicted nucleic acid-binding protein
VILCDTGPLVALVDSSDMHHPRTVATLATLPAEPLWTTWHCLTEAMYLLGRESGFAAQDGLWSYVADDLVGIHPQAAEQWPRMRELMRRYHDTPMDLADASLVAAAETLAERRIFTFDRHFRAYRVGGKHFDIIPG